MKTAVFLLMGLVGSLFIASGATAQVASAFAVVQDISPQFMGQPGYVGLQTYSVSVQYQNPTDVMVGFGSTSIQSTSGTFFNANPVTQDPMGLIPDSGGLTSVVPSPIGPGIIAAFPAYAVWQWDTIFFGGPMAGSTQTPTSITGGATGQGSAGADLMVEIMRITITAGGTFSGQTTVLTQNPSGGKPIATEIIITNDPCPADLNGDGEINTLDLGILLSSWTLPPATACAGTACTADLNGDGAVNSLDLGILLSSWGGC